MTSLLSFAFVLGVLVFFHELGHFVVARLHGVRCLTFALGFGPKLVQTKRGDTVYCICAIPLGGYVKMAGAGEGPDDKPEGKDDEFPSKTKWQRFQILIAGPVMNIILAVLILAGVLYQGVTVPVYLERPPIVGIVPDGSPAATAGIQAGDSILSVAGRNVDTWEEMEFAVAPHADREIDVVLRRDGGERTVQVIPASRGTFKVGVLGVEPDVPPQVVDMMSTTSSAAQEAGILVGDVIEAIEGREVTTESLMAMIQASPDIPLTLRIRRDGVRQDIVVTPQLVGDVGMIGVALNTPYEMHSIELGPFEAFAMSLEQNYETSGLLFQTLWGLLTRDVPVAQLAGPVGILQLSGQAVGVSWVVFFGFMSMLSLNLGILNLLPIPILDGGHIFIMAMEGVSRRDFSVRLKERIALAGFVLLMTLIVTVTYNDLARFPWIERLMIWR